MTRRTDGPMVVWRTLAGAGLLVAAGCSSFTDVPPPSNIVDPTVVQSQDGALTAYRGVLGQFADIFASKYTGGWDYAHLTGLFTDEYTCVASTNTCGASGALSNSLTAQVDLRHEPFDISILYQDLHAVRLQADQAAGLLAAYAPTLPSSYIGQMHAIKGYVYILFGEFYCSGVPFSQVPYGGNITYGKPETTQQMFQDAVAQFDSALTFAGDSARIQRLAMVGKGRALLDLGQFADAAAAVSGVTTDFRYDILYGNDYPNYAHLDFIDWAVADREGTNGLDFASSNDTRLALTNGLPTKFADIDAPVTLADGVEARLIEAEAKLQANDIAGWAGTLNDLRATAGIAALTTDSTTTASATLRQNVMFRERAFWLFGTGHREGDLRRLIRQYGRNVTTVYPIGTSTSIAPPINSYSTLVVVDPPNSEQSNPYYKGCLNHDA
jgi:hypothetical protein